MKKRSYLLESTFLLRLQSGNRGSNLQPGRRSMCQAHKWPEPRESSLGKQAIRLVVLSFFLASCTPSARLVNESSTGGTVLYSYIEEYDVLTSPGRKDALRLLNEKCPAGYRIAREGEVPRVSKAVDKAWMGQVSSNGQVSREKDWAIQFVCK